ncbi:MAG: ATP-grasp domain-containing protein [Candidatus Onthovivens sp.]|nr:ATP-grasp domain-containing protein [Candidatus Onthovivens sp.]
MKTRGIIIYSKIDAKKNYWFIDELIKYFANYDIELNLVLDDEYSQYLTLNLDIKFAINRTRDYKISLDLENKNIKVFNNQIVNKIANNKYLSYLLFKELNLPCMDTYLNIDSSLNYPLVMKEVTGHGGTEVYLVKSKEEIDSIYRLNKNKTYIFQPLCSNIGIDVRVYMFKNEPLVAFKRESINDDFKSNYSLNHKASIFKLDEEMIAICKKITKELNSDYIGVDFIFNNNKWVVNEIEDPVGAWMIYDLTNIDLAKIIVDYILKELNI